jgi:hypothetical protein
MAGNSTAFYNIESDNDLELNHEAEESKVLSVAMVYNNLELWQGSQHLNATMTESHAQNTQVTAVGYSANTKEVLKALWSNFQHDGASAFTLSEKSPLPPALSAKDIPGGRTQVLHLGLFQRINRYPVESDDDSAPESISLAERWLNWNADLDNPNVREDDWDAEDKSNPAQGNGFDGEESPNHQDKHTTQYVPGLLWLTRRLLTQPDRGLMTFTAMETWRNLGHKKM